MKGGVGIFSILSSQFFNTLKKFKIHSKKNSTNGSESHIKLLTSIQKEILSNFEC